MLRAQLSGSFITSWVTLGQVSFPPKPQCSQLYSGTHSACPWNSQEGNEEKPRQVPLTRPGQSRRAPSLSSVGRRGAGIILGAERGHKNLGIKNRWIFTLLYFNFLKSMSLFGCIGTQLWPLGPSVHRVDLLLWHTDPRVKARRLSTCSAWAQLLSGTWDLTSPIRDRTQVSCIARQILNHWTTREVPVVL